MRTLAVLVLLGSLVACAHYATNPAWPVTVPVGVAVIIEDHLEDPACDAVQTSLLEMFDDLLSAPWNILWQVVAFEGSVGWTVADAVVGSPLQPQARFQEILDWLPLQYSGVPPSFEGTRPTILPACSRV